MAKDTTSSYLRLDVRWLQRNGFLATARVSTLRWSRNDEPIGSVGLRTAPGGVMLSYRHRSWEGEPWKDESYHVSIDWTACNYGGTRAWFICPAVGCGRRVAVLYEGGIFACRHCHQLAYDSQHEPPHSRALSRAQAIVEKLGGRWADGFPDKPKGMHWRTYRRLCEEYDRLEERSWSPWLRRLVSACR